MKWFPVEDATGILVVKITVPSRFNLLFSLLSQVTSLLLNQAGKVAAVYCIRRDLLLLQWASLKFER